MDITVYGRAYNGYGRFFGEWVHNLSKLLVRPSKIVFVLGYDHGVSDEDLEFGKLLWGDRLLYVDVPEKITDGAYRNKAMEEVTTEWAVLLAVDDYFTPNAIDLFSEYQKNADVLVPGYYLLKDGKITKKPPQIPRTSDLSDWRGNGFFSSGVNPFRVSFWEKSPYVDYDFPHIPHVFNLVRNGARFKKILEPCFVYRMWEDSLSNSTDQDKIARELDRFAKE